MTTKTELSTEAYKRQWAEIESLVVAYAAKNRLGFLTVWGMLADKVDEGDGQLYDLVLINHVSLYEAVNLLGWGQLFINVAREMFIKFQDNQDMPY